MSSVDPNWVYGYIGLYNARGELASDGDEVMLNRATHQLIGPTNVGLCGAGPDHNQSIGAYGSVPTDVLTSLGLHPCGPASTPSNTPPSVAASSPAATPSSAPPSAAASSSAATTTFQTFAGAWGHHESSLTITSTGHGHLIYADLKACPSCALGNAPPGTLDFALKTVVGGVGMGAVTSSSDAKVSSVGDPVTVKLSPGSPGQLLDVTIAGNQLIPFCNGTSIGQCGA